MTTVRRLRGMRGRLVGNGDLPGAKGGAGSSTIFEEKNTKATVLSDHASAKICDRTV
ncbi:hypothetical protein D3C81_1096710 [compost metagenome]